MGAKYTEAQARATSEYMKDKHTFRVVVTNKEENIIKAHAESKGESLNGFINRAISETMEKEHKTEE